MKLHWKNIKAYKRYLPAILIGEGVILFLSMICYRDLYWALPLQLLFLPGLPEYRKWLDQRTRRLYREGFQEMLRSLMTSMQAGMSLENACYIARQELSEFYEGKNHPILRKAEDICRGIDLNISMDQLFYQFAWETGVEEIYEFAVVLEIARKTGGNLVEILRNTSVHLHSRMETEGEIRINLSGILFEKNIMLLMPVIMLIYMNLTSESYAAAYYETLAGRIMVSSVLVILVICYYWTERIVGIEL